MEKKPKIIIALSGGVDSSVAAALLVQQGYDVTGAYMKQWSDSKDISGVCTWKEDRRDALRVAAHLGIEMLTLDFEKEYRNWVMEYMFAEYEAGRTPNPDVMCNKFIKFGAWLKKINALGFDMMATGHYAVRNEIKKDGKTLYQLGEAKDANKDQTYFLHQLTQEQLSQTLFPLGGYTKDEIREMAAQFNLPTANRAESMGICFVGEVPMKEFLQQKIAPKPGDIVLGDGTIIGQHDGLSFYTIGQRQGLRQQGSQEALYVIEKRQESNELVVGPEDDPALYKKDIAVTDLHMISGEVPSFPFACEVRFRHRQVKQPATLLSAMLLQTEDLQRAITPGQFAVFYKDGTCLGGAIIS